MSKRNKIEDEIEMEEQEEMEKIKSTKTRGVWYYEMEDWPASVNPEEIFDLICAKTRIHYEHKKLNFSKLIVTEINLVSESFDVIYYGIGRIYIKDQGCPGDLIPDHMQRLFPCRRYLKVVFVLSRNRGEDWIVENLCFCEGGAILSEYDTKTKLYHVKLPWSSYLWSSKDEDFISADTSELSTFI